ncbi:LacI family DNA-binding transcriptional regulator [Galbitalea sp. SE-J8]|uniref:LacI family DNA-binding transcriptional regulator n=1 Tax=Galbitalea sp. SE-J8 TaxID=3054952 RepID=UPI00259D2F8C|nr:LacI family DNA-binding transcriptional regulator [Galbitalea sp. SE-J8]MDM4762220.1 LacI family DNA-binding transcriptional regulator [Galbitalea sp. SE-J8]
MTRLPTVDDVGRAAGVSRQTVSNVLNAPDLVRPETRSRVEAAIAELGYRPHASARRLRMRASSTIGIRLDPVADGISGAVLDRFLHALTAQADARGLRVMLYTASDPADEVRQVRRLRDGADVDAFVLTSTFYDDPRTRWLVDNGVPFVTFGRPWGEDDVDAAPHPWVDVDGYAGVRAATEHLLATGARRIAHLGWPSHSGTGDDRRRGWRDALAAAAVVETPDLSIIAEDAVEAARAAVDLTLRTGGGFDGIVCASDSLALGALLALGPPAPDARPTPVIGFDDTPVAAALGLSSVEQPLELVAAGALELLFGPSGATLVERPAPGTVGPDAASAPLHRLVTPRLVIR